jgi:hypothetical protein
MVRDEGRGEVRRERSQEKRRGRETERKGKVGSGPDCDVRAVRQVHCTSVMSTPVGYSAVYEVSEKCPLLCRCQALRCLPVCQCDICVCVVALSTAVQFH